MRRNSVNDQVYSHLLEFGYYLTKECLARKSNWSKENGHFTMICQILLSIIYVIEDSYKITYHSQNHFISLILSWKELWMMGHIYM